MHKEFIFYQSIMTARKDNGFIYVFSKPTYPGAVKIGKTTRLPGRRAVQLSNSTAVPTSFAVRWCRFVEKELCEIETSIHKQFDEFRINGKREFFKLSVSDAIKKADAIIDDFFSAKLEDQVYRKIQDLRWNYFFERLNIPFEYITEPIKIMDGVGFMPDFWLSEQDCYFIVSNYFLGTDAGKMMAYCLAQKTGKVVFQFWECEAGLEFEEDGELFFHTGTYLTPEGEFDGVVEWGICLKCGSKHIGHLGFPELCDRAYRNISKFNCTCYTGGENKELLEAYYKVGLIFGTDD